MARRKKRTLSEDFEMSGKPKRRKKRSGKKTIKKAAPKRARRSKKAKTSKPKRPPGQSTAPEGVSLSGKKCDQTITPSGQVKLRRRSATDLRLAAAPAWPG
jgi:hypothetical protein